MNDSTDETIIPRWVAEHKKRYLASDGADGHMFDSTPFGGDGLIPTLLLTTTGRKTGLPRTMPLLYTETSNGDCVVIASKGGAPKHPVWYLNLTAQPEVELQVKADKLRARARIASGEERAALWKQHQAAIPVFDGYQKKAGKREIPVVILERI